MHTYDQQHIMGKITGQFGAEIINYTCVLVYTLDVYVMQMQNL